MAPYRGRTLDADGTAEEAREGTLKSREDADDHPSTAPTQRGMSNLTQHLIEFRMNVTLLTHRGKRLDSLNEISKSNPPPNPDSVDLRF